MNKMKWLDRMVFPLKTNIIQSINTLVHSLNLVHGDGKALKPKAKNINKKNKTGKGKKNKCHLCAKERPYHKEYSKSIWLGLKKKKKKICLKHFSYRPRIVCSCWVQVIDFVELHRCKRLKFIRPSLVLIVESICHKTLIVKTENLCDSALTTSSNTVDAENIEACYSLGISILDLRAVCCNLLW